MSIIASRSGVFATRTASPRQGVDLARDAVADAQGLDARRGLREIFFLHEQRHLPRRARGEQEHRGNLARLQGALRLRRQAVNKVGFIDGQAVERKAGADERAARVLRRILAARMQQAHEAAVFLFLAQQFRERLAVARRGENGLESGARRRQRRRIAHAEGGQVTLRGHRGKNVQPLRARKDECLVFYEVGHGRGQRLVGQERRCERVEPFAFQLRRQLVRRGLRPCHEYGSHQLLRFHHDQCRRKGSRLV